MAKEEKLDLSNLTPDIVRVMVKTVVNSKYTKREYNKSGIKVVDPFTIKEELLHLILQENGHVILDRTAKAENQDIFFDRIAILDEYKLTSPVIWNRSKKHPILKPIIEGLIRCNSEFAHTSAFYVSFGDLIEYFKLDYVLFKGETKEIINLRNMLDYIPEYVHRLNLHDGWTRKIRVNNQYFYNIEDEHIISKKYMIEPIYNYHVDGPLTDKLLKRILFYASNGTNKVHFRYLANLLTEGCTRSYMYKNLPEAILKNVSFEMYATLKRFALRIINYSLANGQVPHPFYSKLLPYDEYKQYIHNDYLKVKDIGYGTVYYDSSCTVTYRGQKGVTFDNKFIFDTYFDTHPDINEPKRESDVKTLKIFMTENEEDADALSKFLIRHGQYTDVDKIGYLYCGHETSEFHKRTLYNADGTIKQYTKADRRFIDGSLNGTANGYVHNRFSAKMNVFFNAPSDFNDNDARLSGMRKCFVFVMLKKDNKTYDPYIDVSKVRGTHFNRNTIKVDEEIYKGFITLEASDFNALDWLSRSILEDPE